MKHRTRTWAIALMACAISVALHAEEKFLEVPKDVKAVYAKFLKLHGAGMIKLMPRGVHGGVTRAREGGACYSFALHTHESRTSDIKLDVPTVTRMVGDPPMGELPREHKPPPPLLRVGLGGVDYGFFSSLGDFPIEAVPTDPRIFPQVDPQKQQAWQDIGSYRPPHTEPQLREEQARLRDKNRVPAVEGVTYLVRSTLAAIRVVQVNGDGSMILLWRALKTWKPPMPPPRPPSQDWVPADPR